MFFSGKSQMFVLSFVSNFIVPYAVLRYEFKRYLVKFAE